MGVMAGTIPRQAWDESAVAADVCGEVVGRRGARSMFVLALLVLSLTGCFNLSAQLDIDREGQGRGDVTFEMSRRAAALMNVFSAEQLLQGIRANSAGSAASSGSAKVWDGDWKTSETDQSYRLTRRMAIANGDLYTVTTNGNQQTFEIPAQGGGSGANLELEVTFAGAIQSVSGQYATKVSDRTVRIVGPLGQTPTMVQVDLSKAPSAAYVPLLVVFLFAFAGGLWWLLRRRKPNSRSGSDGAAESVEPAPPVVASGDEPTSSPPQS